MNSSNFILLLIAALFFVAGTFGHRFERHTTTKNGIIGNEKIGEGVHLLSADKEAPTVSDGENVTLTGPGNAQLQLTNGKLEFEFCTPNCMGQTITGCYDAVNRNPLLQGSCLSNQCELRARVTELDGEKILAFNSHSKPFTSDICVPVTMQFPNADVSFTNELESCDPLLSDNNVINLSVTFVGPTSECYLKVLNAKKWIPATTPAPSNSTSESQIASTEEKEDSSSALMPLWIVLGIFLFVLVAAVIVIGICCWRKQKKSSAAPAAANGGKANQALTENKTKTDGGNAIEETVGKTEAAKPKVPDAKEKKEIVEQPKPAKKPKVEEKKAVVQEKQPKEDAQVVSAAVVDDVDPFQKPSAEPSKVSAEPTVQDATTEPSSVQPIQQHLKGPKIDIPSEPVVPRPRLYHRRSQSGSRSHIRDSLSGVHDPAMHLLVQSQPAGLERLCDSPGLIEEQKLDRFYPSTAKRHLQPPQDREKALFCASNVFAMLDNVDAMRIDAQDALADVGVKFDQNMEIESMPEEAVNYLRLPTTPEFVRSYAFGSLFRKLIDDHAPGNKIYSVPLLFAILLQHRYSPLNRRKIAVYIRRELVIIHSEFSLKERSSSAFPVNVTEYAAQLDQNGFRNVASFLKQSGLAVEENATQTLANASGKRGKKNSGGGKKKKRSQK